MEDKTEIVSTQKCKLLFTFMTQDIGQRFNDILNQHPLYSTYTALFVFIQYIPRSFRLHNEVLNRSSHQVL